ncbi:hypothetical protein GGR58DRAFT_497689 [Xylaria digitata]|nr:hypothetical protein GGR58DRAFT_497689 [Xylaria digitata]
MGIKGSLGSAAQALAAILIYGLYARFLNPVDTMDWENVFGPEGFNPSAEFVSENAMYEPAIVSLYSIVESFTAITIFKLLFWPFWDLCTDQIRTVFWFYLTFWLNWTLVLVVYRSFLALEMYLGAI